MRILIDMQGAQNDSRFRGIGRYINALLGSLIETRAAGDDIVLLLNGNLADGESAVRASFSGLLGPECFKVWYPLSPASWGRPQNVARRRASQAIREWAIRELAPDCMLVMSLFEGCGDDVVTSMHSHNMPPTAVVFYDLIPYLFPDQYLVNPMLRGWYEDKLEQLRCADRLLAISDSSRREVIEHIGIPEEKVTTISSGINAEQFRKQGASWTMVARKYGVPGRYLLYAGAADPRKNLEAFMRAVACLPASEISDVSVVMVGQITDTQKNSLEKIARLLPHGSKQLIFTGHVSDDELIAFYRNALAFVFPSLHEGFGLPLLEAMAAGCPVIASNSSAFPEVVGTTEALFDPLSVESMAGLIRQVVADSDYRDRLVREQSQRVALFSWDVVAQRVWSTLRDLKASSRDLGEELNKGRLSLLTEVSAELRGAGASLKDFLLATQAIQRTARGVRNGI